MDISLVFKIVNGLALIQWLFMAIIPGNEITAKLVNSNAIPILLAIVYMFYIVTNFGKAKGSFGSLEGVVKLFKNKKVVLAGWVHYLVFDLFVGVWIWREALQSGMSQFLLIPFLFLTLMFGPIGFLFYLIYKFFQ